FVTGTSARLGRPPGLSDNGRAREHAATRGHMMADFSTIRARAAARKGGEAVLQSLLPAAPPNAALAAVTDDRVLSVIAKRIFSAGFVWRVIDQKWPGFEEAFLGFEPKRLLFQPDDFWDGLASD